MYNAGERKDVRRAEKDARLAEQQRRETVSQVMSTIPGRRWMLDRLEECHVFRTSFNRDPTSMAFAEGQRDIGLKFLNDIMASCPDLYMLMMRESNERRIASERARSQDGNGRDQGSGSDGYSTDGDASSIDPEADGSQA